MNWQENGDKATPENPCMQLSCFQYRYEVIAKWWTIRLTTVIIRVQIPAMAGFSFVYELLALI